LIAPRDKSAEKPPEIESHPAEERIPTPTPESGEIPALEAQTGDAESSSPSSGEEEEVTEWMTIMSDWGLAKFKEGEGLKAGFHYIFRPDGRKWKLVGRMGTFTTLSWRRGSFWYEEETRVMCRKSKLELTKRNQRATPRTEVPKVDTED
jgi:hypothetical protein